MRKSVVALAAAALFGVVSIAATADVTGTIKSIDPATATVTLDNGQTFALSAALKSQVANWKVGDKVKITFEGTGAKMSATAVSPAS